MIGNQIKPIGSRNSIVLNRFDGTYGIQTIIKSWACGPVREIDMSRFIQENSNKTPKKEPTPRVLPKPGQYTSVNLTEAKKIITPEGGKR